MFSLYTATGSNSSQRVEWALRYKQLPFRSVEVTDASLKTDYRKLNPFGYVPALRVDNQIITESMAISEYLEEVQPTPPLFPEDRYDRARVRQICEYVNATIHTPQNRSVLEFLRPELTHAEKPLLRAAWIQQGLTTLAPQLWRDSAFAIGAQFTLADIFVATIYKKARQHGMNPLSDYENHIMALRNHAAIAQAEPAAAYG